MACASASRPARWCSSAIDTACSELLNIFARSRSAGDAIPADVARDRARSCPGTQWRPADLQIDRLLLGPLNEVLSTIGTPVVSKNFCTTWKNSPQLASDQVCNHATSRPRASPPAHLRLDRAVAVNSMYGDGTGRVPGTTRPHAPPEPPFLPGQTDARLPRPLIVLTRAQLAP